MILVFDCLLLHHLQGIENQDLLDLRKYMACSLYIKYTYI